MSQLTAICLDLKSYYASVECVERGLDPLTTNLVVADESRTDKTICLAVSPSLKAYGISGRARLFEVKDRLREIKAQTGETVNFIIARPQMAKYLRMSAEIYGVYLKYIAPQDIHVYSVDEVFIDASKYLKTYQMSAHELAITMIRDVLATAGITATAGVGSNLYLAKIAMDIVAKHSKADSDGVRIAELDEQSYRELLWDHKPLTDFWRIGPGISRRLECLGITTMGELARLSIHNESLLYKVFGIDAEILIDHAWGIETCSIEDIKGYRPTTSSLSQGQVLKRPYYYNEAKIIVQEMVEQIILDLVEQNLCTNAIVLHVSYDSENISKQGSYVGAVKKNYYGKNVPASAHGTAKLSCYTFLESRIMPAVMKLYEEIVDKRLTIRRLNVAAIRLVREADLPLQMDLFSDYVKEEREKNLQRTIIEIQRRYGKNAVLKGHDLMEGSTTIERNGQIGGHRS